MSDIWKTIHIHNWSDFESKIGNLKRREWLFRGQSRASWHLDTSYSRLFRDIQPIIENAKGSERKFAEAEHERLLVRAFQKNANLYLPFLPERKKTLDWLAIMQHYGTPTRLLDVTLSPYIALYFALEADSGDCCIFAINHAEIKNRNQRVLIHKTYKRINDNYFVNEPKPDDPDNDNLFSEGLKAKQFITVFSPQYGNERWVIQQGLFLVPSQIDRSFEDLLEEYDLDIEGDICKKFVIHAPLRFEGIDRLRQMNLTSATLFLGIDGFCKSLKFQVLETTRNQKLLE